MKNASLYICDRDTVYLEKLTSFILRRSFSPFLVKTVDSIEKIPDEYQNEGILLVASSMLSESVDRIFDVDRTIILNEGELNRRYEKYHVIGKYQAASDVYEQLLKCQADREDILFHNVSGTCKTLELWGIYPPIHRIGKSVYTRRLCTLEGSTRKVLLFDFEVFSKRTDSGMCLSDLIYYYKQEKVHMAFDLSDLLVHEQGYDYIRPVRCPLDLKDMSVDDWLALFDIIERLSIYDLLVIDFEMLPEDLKLLEKCGKIYVPVIEDTEECRRIEAFESFVEMIDNGHLKECMERVIMEG